LSYQKVSLAHGLDAEGAPGMLLRSAPKRHVCPCPGPPGQERVLACRLRGDGPRRKLQIAVPASVEGPDSGLGIEARIGSYVCAQLSARADLFRRLKSSVMLTNASQAGKRKSSGPANAPVMPSNAPSANPVRASQIGSAPKRRPRVDVAAMKTPTNLDAPIPQSPNQRPCASARVESLRLSSLPKCTTKVGAAAHTAAVVARITNVMPLPRKTVAKKWSSR
jgi:hypothetical protein